MPQQPPDYRKAETGSCANASMGVTKFMQVDIIKPGGSSNLIPGAFEIMARLIRDISWNHKFSTSIHGGDYRNCCPVENDRFTPGL